MSRGLARGNEKGRTLADSRPQPHVADMLLQISQRSTSADVFDRMLSCHARIRHHASLAVRLSEALASPASEVAEAASQVHRYFSKALPLHARDEELTLAPRLRGLSSEIDGALAAMIGEHAEHEPLLETLVSLCGELATHPDRLVQVAQSLSECSRNLEAAFSLHLEHEERVVFPAARAHIPDDEKARMAAELDERHRAGPGFARAF